MVSLIPKVSDAFRMDLLISTPDGQAFLCVQFRTKSGLSPAFAIPVANGTPGRLEHIQRLVDGLSSAVAHVILPDFADVGPDPDVEMALRSTRQQA